SRIPHVVQRGEYLYNFWKDSEHPRGIYRRTTLNELRSEDPEWETVLDVDALAEEEGKPWVFHGMTCLPPEHRHCLVSLSPGGGDADEVREFDAETLEFVEDGFFLPVAKSNVAWRTEDEVFVGTDFGEGSLTDSGYPRIVKLWQRGTPLEEAETLYEAESSSVAAWGSRLRTDEGDIDLVGDQKSFWTSSRYQLLDGELHPLELPETAVVEDAFRARLLISLKNDWSRDETTYREGTVLIADPAALRGGEGSVETLVDPEEGEVVEDVTAAKEGVLVTMLDDVRGRLYRYDPAEEDWSRRSIPFPDNGALHVTTVDDETGDFFAQYESFVSPPTLYHVAADDLEPEKVKGQEPTFEGSKFEVEQHWATSADGTEVPYFVVFPKGTEWNGKNPTHIFSYGGFRNSLTPSYSGTYEDLYGTYGKLWLERGGVFVSANIRGGGEFGPAWHEAALLENRPRAFEDFEAVAEDLIERKITSPEHLGIEGRSNGGLLVLSTMIRRPDLYGAVIAGVPLADMKRYHELLAGASWMAEYGDPDDPEDWAFIREYSPYQNLEADQGYPPVFFYTSTRDDRVHPGHARKMAARMEEMGYEVWYYENTEGGHGGSVTNEQLAYRVALAYTHLWTELGSSGPVADSGD
ncbi:MAG: prolyl oligopeptidase family serine peptidase, partial [Thermoanaerobaculia bacterium]|nr:prolyl oligopeptidase family serine peptidase [Thermoanaerobaculia bacterium]